jgi:hypothetical protein
VLHPRGAWPQFRNAITIPGVQPCCSRMPRNLALNDTTRFARRQSAAVHWAEGFARRSASPGSRARVASKL